MEAECWKVFEFEECFLRLLGLLRLCHLLNKYVFIVYNKYNTIHIIIVISLNCFIKYIYVCMYATNFFINTGISISLEYRKYVCLFVCLFFF